MIAFRKTRLRRRLRFLSTPRRRRLLASIVAAFALAAALPRRAEALFFVPVGPPGNPHVTAMAIANANYVAPNPPPTLLIAAAASGVFVSGDGGGSWTSTGSPAGGSPVSLTVRQVLHPGVDTGSFDTTVFAATTAGVSRLLPGASGWAAANSGLGSTDVRVLAVSGDGVASVGREVRVFAGTAAGLFASDDNGDTWVARPNGLPGGSDAAITALASDPTDRAVLYAGTSVGLYGSSDGGETWAKLDTGAFRFSVAAVAVDPLSPSRIYAAGIDSPLCAPACLGPSFSVSLRSLDRGRTWGAMDGLGGHVVRAFAATRNLPATVFAATEDAGVYVSGDGGSAWSPGNGGSLRSNLITAIVVDPQAPSFVFAATPQGVFCSPLSQVPATCIAGDTTHCLLSHRFQVTVSWRDTAGSTSGDGHDVPMTDDAGAFWFFTANNIELAVKVVDGRAANGRFWIFFGSLTNVEFTLTVTDTRTGQVRTYVNPSGRLASFADTAAF